MRSAYCSDSAYKIALARQHVPLGTTSGRRSKHLPPLCARPLSGSALMGSTRLLTSASRLAVSSFRHREISLLLNMRAADVGIVFWKKARSSTFMARFSGGANMSSNEPAEDMDGYVTRIVLLPGWGLCWKLFWGDFQEQCGCRFCSRCRQRSLGFSGALGVVEMYISNCLLYKV